MDIFEKKILKVPFTEFDNKFPMEHAHDPNKVKGYIKSEYRTRFYHDVDPRESPRKIHFHVLSATDTKQIQDAMRFIQFETVRSPIVSRYMMF